MATWVTSLWFQEVYSHFPYRENVPIIEVAELSHFIYVIFSLVSTYYNYAGKYWDGCVVKKSSKASMDENDCHHLWDYSANLLEIDPNYIHTQTRDIISLHI